MLHFLLHLLLDMIHCIYKFRRNNVSKENLVLHLNRDTCKGCGICVAFCPTNVLEMAEDNKCEIINIEKCIKCGLCELRCPDFAIYLEEDKDEK